MLKTKKKENDDAKKTTRVNAAGYGKATAYVLMLLTISLSLCSCKPKAQEPQWLEETGQETGETVGAAGNREDAEKSDAALDGQDAEKSDAVLDGQDADPTGLREENSGDTYGMSDEKTQTEAARSDAEAETALPAQCYVHVCGAVATPGVYILQEGSRVVDAVTAAGGTLEDASEEAVNQALVVTDGMQIYVPTTEEARQGQDWIHNGKESGAVTTGAASGGSNSGGNSTGSASGKVNINTADAVTLCTLPGIGESRASSIIAYREEHGSFAAIEDIMKVSGIKDAAFGKIKDKICVK